MQMKLKEINELFEDMEEATLLEEMMIDTNLSSKYNVNKVHASIELFDSIGDSWGISDNRTYELNELDNAFTHGFITEKI